MSVNNDNDDISSTKVLFNKDILQDWSDDDNDNEILAQKEKQRVNFLSSVQETVNQITRESLPPNKDESNDENNIETMLKNLLLSDNNTNSKELPFEEMLSKLLGKELLYAPLHELYLEVCILTPYYLLCSIQGGFLPIKNLVQVLLAQFLISINADLRSNFHFLAN